jgi:hypothetical protein
MQVNELAICTAIVGASISCQAAVLQMNGTKGKEVNEALGFLGDYSRVGSAHELNEPTYLGVQEHP